MPPLSLHCHGHQRPQGTRNQQTAGQMSRSKPAALALPSHVTKSHSVSREIRSVRPLCTSQVYPVSHFQFPPGEHVRLAWSCADQFRPRRVASHYEELLRTLLTTELSATRSACSGCARLRCCPPLPHHRLQLLHSFHQFYQLFLWVLQRRQTVCRQAKSQLSKMPPRTVLRARQDFLSCGDAETFSSTTVCTAHSQYCLSWAHTHSKVLPRCLPKFRMAWRDGSRSACASLWFRLVSQRDVERHAENSQLAFYSCDSDKRNCKLDVSPLPK